MARVTSLYCVKEWALNYKSITGPRNMRIFSSICVNQNNNHWECSAPESIKQCSELQSSKILEITLTGYGCTNYLPLAKHSITTSFCLGRLKKLLQHSWFVGPDWDLLQILMEIPKFMPKNVKIWYTQQFNTASIYLPAQQISFRKCS